MIECPESWYGSLTEETYRKLVTKHPFWFHVTPKENLASILRDGLRAGDPRTLYGESLQSRPDCTYFMNDYEGHWCWDYTNLDTDTGVMLAVDLRLIERERILPDEDDLSEAMGRVLDPHDYGLPRSEEGAWVSTGAWAEAIRLGEQPGLCDEAVQGSKLAVRGPIAPELLCVCELDPEAIWDSLTKWVERQLVVELAA
jgi:hypothetical protein